MDNQGAADDSAFERFVALLDYPMFVVTTRAGDSRSGCLVGFASQTSIDPSRFLIGLSKKNHTYGVAEKAEYVVVHVLPRSSVSLAELFGGQTGDEVDKFAQCKWHEGPYGVPVLDDAAAWFAGRIIGRADVGDHAGLFLEPVDGATPHATAQLVKFADVRDLEPGHDA